MRKLRMAGRTRGVVTWGLPGLKRTSARLPRHGKMSVRCQVVVWLSQKTGGPHVLCLSCFAVSEKGPGESGTSEHDRGVPASTRALMSRPDVVASSGFIPEADFKELLPSDNIIDDLISRKKVLCFSLCSSICLRTERTCAFSPFLG